LCSFVTAINKLGGKFNNSRTALIPLCALVLYGLICASKSAYYAGGETAKCFIPAIVAGLFIYFLLKKKFGNENKVKFPIALVILMGIALIGGIITKTLEYKNKKMVEQLYSEISNLDNSTSIEEYESREVFNELNFNGLSFCYPENWKVGTEVLQENLGFQVSCEKKGLSSDMIFVVWLRGTNFGTTTEMIENSIAGINEEMSAYNAKATAGNMHKSNFKGNEAVALDYTITLFGEKTYGKLVSFIMNGNTVVITKQSDEKSKLLTEFQTIEESFNLE
jgi:hypothetical protein